MTDEPRLHLRLLGEFQLCRANTVVEELSARRLQLLIAYLALRRGTTVDRSHLASLLWPDSTGRQARTNLRHLFHTLRRALPEFDRLIVDAGSGLSWRPGVTLTSDIAGFEDALARADAAEQRDDVERAVGDLERAIACYTGDLLLGHYDDWVLTERERLAQAFLGALERAAELRERQGDNPRAMRHCQRLVRADPLRESSYRTLMRLHTASGDRAAALQVYHACVSTLERELGVAPSAETQTTYQALLTGVAQEFAPIEYRSAASQLLIGRDHEWSRLRQLWRDAAAGRPQMVLLSGEAGIGKTRLAEDLLGWINRQEMTALSARCYAGEGSLSFAPILIWLRSEAVQAVLPKLDDAWLTEVARLLPEVLTEWPDLPPPTPLTEGWQRQRLFEALAHAILGASQPLAMLIDDLQWCDRDTLEWLRFFLRFQSNARLLVLGTLRPEELTADHPLLSLVVSLHRDDRLTEITLQPLDEQQAAALAVHLTGRALSADNARGLFRETEGNPLFVVETARAGFAAGSDPAAMPPVIQSVIASRFALLSPTAAGLLEVVATIGREFNYGHLRTASATDEDTLIQGLDELWRRRIIRERGGSIYDFTHDKLREVAYEQLSLARRRLLHRRVAEAIEHDPGTDGDAASSQIALHLERAGLPERAAASYLRAAAHARRLYANHEAIALYRRGLTLMDTANPVNGALTGQLLDGLADVLDLIGRPQEARDAYRRALEVIAGDDHLQIARIHCNIGNTWASESRDAQALAAYAAAEAGLGEDTRDRGVWIDIQLARMGVCYRHGQWQQMHDLAGAIAPVVEQQGSALQRIALAQRSAHANMRRDRYAISDATLALMRAALTIAREIDDLAKIADAEFQLGFGHLWRGELEDARHWLEHAQALAEQTGDSRLEVLCLTYLAVTSRRLRHADETRRWAGRALALATTVEMQWYIGVAEANLAWLAWKNGDLAEAERLGRAAIARWQGGGYPFQWLALWPLIEIALARDDLSTALDHARALLDERQLRLPAALEAQVESAPRAGDAGDGLRRAVEQAGELRLR